MFITDAPSSASGRAAASVVPWHRHTLCVGPAGGTVATGHPCPVGDASYPSPDMVHVWLSGVAADPLAADMTPAMVCSRPVTDAKQ